MSTPAAILALASDHARTHAANIGLTTALLRCTQERNTALGVLVAVCALLADEQATHQALADEAQRWYTRAVMLAEELADVQHGRDGGCT